MKFLFLLTFLPSVVFGAEFNFTYVFVEGRIQNKLQYKTEAASWDEAMEKGANFCYNFFAAGKDMDKKKGLDIIDVCANPK